MDADNDAEMGAVARAHAEHEREPRGANEPSAEEDDDSVRANADVSFLHTWMPPKSVPYNKLCLKNILTGKMYDSK